MTEQPPKDYGWTKGDTANCTHSCAYLAPKILDILKQLQANRILDVGAGDGKLCGVLSREGYDIAGVEYDAQGVEIAKGNCPGVPFYHFGVEDNPADLLAIEKPFDAVVSTEVIEHLFSPHHLPIYAAGVLKDHGYLIVSTPYHGYLKNLALAVFDKWDSHHSPLWSGGHIKFWSRATLTRLLETNGFHVIGFHGVGRQPYLWKSMIMVAQKKT